MSEALSDPDGLAATMKHEARTRPMTETQRQLDMIVASVRAMPPMPEDPERIAVIRSRGKLFSEVASASAETHTSTDEETARGFKAAFLAPYRVHGEPRVPDAVDRAWIWEFGQQYRVYRDNPLDWGCDAQLCYRQFPDLPFAASLTVVLGLQEEMLQGAKERGELN